MKIILLLLLLIIILNYLYVREYFTDNLDLDKENEEEMDLAQWFERATELKIDIFDDD